MVSQPKGLLTPAEYLAAERRGTTKHEYYDGTVVAMVGASWAHNLIVGDTYYALATRLNHTGCEPVANDMRVWVPTRRSYLYPDLVVVCGAPEFQDSAVDTLLNPTLVAEVLSPSTAAFDLGAKFAYYRSLPSLQEYLLIAQERPHLTLYRREADGRWWLSEAEGLAASIELLTGGGLTLPLAEVYARVRFAEAAGGASGEGEPGA